MNYEFNDQIKSHYKFNSNQKLFHYANIRNFVEHNKSKVVKII